MKQMTLLALASVLGSAPAIAATDAPVFSHPTNITNKYVPLSTLKMDVLKGRSVKHTFRVERTLLNGTKTFRIGKQTVMALIVEDRDYADGVLEEITKDYFAQGDDGTVYYLGEDVDNYRGGKVVGHSGAWLYGKQTKKLGVLMAASPHVGVKWQLETVPGVTLEDDNVVSVNETVVTPLGTYRNCVKVRETTADEVEYKYYAPGVGVVWESGASGGGTKLVKH
jgi:hypothetical protein